MVKPLVNHPPPYMGGKTHPPKGGSFLWFTIGFTNGLPLDHSAEVRLYRPARLTDPATGVFQNGLRIARWFNYCTLATLDQKGAGVAHDSGSMTTTSLRPHCKWCLMRWFPPVAFFQVSDLCIMIILRYMDDISSQHPKRNIRSQDIPRLVNPSMASHEGIFDGAKSL